MSASAAEQETLLGPLNELLGVWVSNHGQNVVAVPKDRSKHLFDLKVRPYVETITFEPIGAPVPNHGGSVSQFVGGVKYDLRVTDKEDNTPLHVENGMWLYLDNIKYPQDVEEPIDGFSIPYPIARQASIPHGNVVMALGTMKKEITSPVVGPFDDLWRFTPQPDFPDTTSLPIGQPPHASFGYEDPYHRKNQSEADDIATPSRLLYRALENQYISEFTILDVSTANQGGIVSIPFIETLVPTTFFHCVYCIEKAEDLNTGANFM